MEGGVELTKSRFPPDLGREWKIVVWKRQWKNGLSRKKKIDLAMSAVLCSKNPKRKEKTYKKGNYIIKIKVTEKHNKRKLLNLSMHFVEG